MVPLFLRCVISICSFFIWIFISMKILTDFCGSLKKIFFFFETWNLEFETRNFENWNFGILKLEILKLETWDHEIWNMEFEIWKFATWNFKTWDFENLQFEILKLETWDWIWNLECGILSLGMKILNWNLEFESESFILNPLQEFSFLTLSFGNWYDPFLFMISF